MALDCDRHPAGGVESTFKISATAALLSGIFVVTAFGYLLDSISIQGVSLMS